MAVKKGECYYKVLRGLIRDCKYGQIEPVLTTYVKKHGIVGGSVGRMLVHYLCMKNNVNSAIRLVSKLKEDNFSVSFPADVLTVLTRRGRVLDAYRLVVGTEDNLPILDVVDYAVVIDGLCKRGYIERALSLCGFARKKGIELNVVMYNSILNGLCFHSCLVEAFRLFDSLERNNIVPSVVTYGTLIDALVREGFLLGAREMFDRMILKGIKLNTHIYNSLIEGYCRFGNVQEALKLLNDLEVISLKPDEFTISAVIDGLCREGDLEEALHFFVHAKRKGISPDFLGFLYLVRGLCSKGRMEEARSILRLMLQTDSVVELINRVDIEIETDSVEIFLVHLCEQGSIQEAVIILSEIGSMFFPCKKQAAYSRKRQAPNLALGITDAMGVEQEVECCRPSGQGSRPHDFNAFYLQLASLCSAGDLQAASKLAKETISLLDKN